MAFQRDLERPVGHGLCQTLDKVAVGCAKKLDDDRALIAVDGSQEPVGIFFPRLADVTQNEYRAPAKAGDVADILGQRFGIAVCRAAAVVQRRECGRRATACAAVVGAASHAEGGGNRIAQPALEGDETRQIAIARHGFDHVAIVDQHVVQGSWAVGQVIDLARAVRLPPGQVGDFRQR